MKKSMKAGFGFGLTSGIITTLGLMAGLAGTNTQVVLGGIITIAIADAFSDSLGMHISKESEHAQEKEIWSATFSTFITKLIVALTFAVPVILLDLQTALIASVVWGFSLLSIFSYSIATKKDISPWKAVAEHLLLAIVVITITYFVGQWVTV
jgi:vacuolar iron transporter family protein